MRIYEKIARLTDQLQTNVKTGLPVAELYAKRKDVVSLLGEDASEYKIMVVIDDKESSVHKLVFKVEYYFKKMEVVDGKIVTRLNNNISRATITVNPVFPPLFFTAESTANKKADPHDFIKTHIVRKLMLFMKYDQEFSPSISYYDANR